MGLDLMRLLALIIFINNLVIAIIIYLAPRDIGAVFMALAIALAITDIGLGANPVWVLLELSAYAMAISKSRKLIPMMAAALITAAVMETLNILTRKT
ncbi:MAG: hypothetical protein RXN86_05610 [Vulcanisaeta sp.]